MILFQPYKTDQTVKKIRKRPTSEGFTLIKYIYIQDEMFTFSAGSRKFVEIKIFKTKITHY